MFAQSLHKCTMTLVHSCYFYSDKELFGESDCGDVSSAPAPGEDRCVWSVKTKLETEYFHHSTSLEYCNTVRFHI